VLFKDPRNAFPPPYDAVLLVSGAAAERPGFVKALAPLVGAIHEKAMRRANYPVDVDHWTPQREKRDLTAALKFYCGMEHDAAHGAEADVLATLAILDAQVVHYAELPRTIDELHALQVQPDAIDFDGHFRRNAADGRIYFNFGKYKNEGSRSIPGWWSGGASQPLQSDEPFRNEEHRRWNPDRPNLRLGGGPAGSPCPRRPRSCWRSRSASAGAISTWE
jgi:hypothetical protein